MLELLAPAGSMEALRAAVQNGANAVYLGCGQFNARQSAKNFTPQALTEAIQYCHIRGVAVHLTLNTLVSDKETQEAAALIRYAANAGVDAFIVQDLGIIQLCKSIAPHIPLHGSTQMSVHSLPGVQFCAGLGISRVVLSRELSREEIRYICENSPIEIEVFGHGALCMSYSGQCYLSAAIGGRSGNRGRCAQPCRQSYGYSRWENKYPLSLKDNCTVQYVKDLEEMGVASLKIEGRMKRPEYVAGVIGVYRQAIDTGRVTKPMLDTLATAFNRQGFTDYYTGKVGPNMFGIRDESKTDERWAKEMRKTYEAAENPLVKVVFDVTVKAGQTTLTVADEAGHKCTVTGPAPEPARSAGLTHEELALRLGKTGGTPYQCVNVRSDIAPGLMLSAAAINGLRRDALNQLTVRRARHNSEPLGRPPRLITHKGPTAPPEFTAQVTTREQITPKLLRFGLSVLYVPLHILTADPEFTQSLARKVNVCAALPRIVHDGELGKLRQDLLDVRRLGVREALIGNVGLLLPVRECGLRARGDFGLNLYSSAAVNFARDLQLRSACLSFEMTLPQIRDVSKGVPCELLAYGRLPLMVTENCLLRNRTGQCTCHAGAAKLVDKTGAEFPIVKDGDSCRSVLLNGKKLFWLDRQDDLARLGLWANRLYFTTENPREVDRVLSACTESASFDPGACTRGLYLRGVE